MSLVSIWVPCCCMRSANWDFNSTTRSGLCSRMVTIWSAERGAFCAVIRELVWVSLFIPESSRKGDESVDALPLSSAVAPAVLWVVPGTGMDWPFAGAPASKENAAMPAAKKQAIRERRVPSTRTREHSLGIMLFKWAQVTGCRTDILLSASDRKELRGVGCHTFVSELSFHCFGLYEPRRQRLERICDCCLA